MNLTMSLVDNSSQTVNQTVLEPELHNVDDFYYAVSIAQTVIAIIGIIFNSLNIYVLVCLIRRRRGVSPTYHLLLAMGIADLTVLAILAFVYLQVYTRDPPLKLQDLTDDHHDYFHILHYLWTLPINIFSITSNWLVVATTVFRFLAVAFPMKVCQWCTLLRIRISIMLVFFVAVTVNIPNWFTLRIYKREDGRIRAGDTELYDSIGPYYFAYHIIEIYVPFVVNLLLVIFLIINLRKTRSSMAKSIQDDNTAAREREHRKIGIMLIAIVIWFITCNIPVIIYQILRDTSGDKRSEIENTPEFMKFSILKDLGPVLNHSGNIVFYCLCNSTYRRMFTSTLLCKKKQFSAHSRGTQITTVSTRHEYMSRLRASRRPQVKHTETQHNKLNIPGRESSPFLNSNGTADSRRVSLASYSTYSRFSDISDTQEEKEQVL